MSASLFQEFEKAIKEAARKQAFELAHGNAETYSDYQRQCGVIAGLNMSLDVLEETFRNMVEREKND
jgi:predicted secreted protein